MLKFVVQGRIQPLEKNRFNQLTKLIDNSQQCSIVQIRGKIKKLLGQKYELCHTGQSLWIYRRYNHSAVAVISEV